MPRTSPKNNFTFVDNDADLASFAKRARVSDVLAIDTEFLREKTYYPQLCLFQMATRDEVVLVDPLTVSSLEALAPLFADERIVKVLHAATQDLEIIHHELSIVPAPLFDTQVAASVLGHSLQIGYGPLVSSVCNVQLKKSDSFTDWSRRPLSKSQLAYAADDVFYLPEIYDAMSLELEKLGRDSWVASEFSVLADPSHYETDPRERYKKLKHVNQLTQRQLAAAREVAAWREHYAETRNIPRKWVLSDEQVIEACRKEPDTLDQLFTIRGMSEKLDTRRGREVLDAIKRGFALPKSERPAVVSSGRNERNVDIEVDALSAILHKRAREHNIAPQVLASQSDLASVARGYDMAEVLHGWRRKIVGEELLDFMEGRISLSVEDRSLKVTKR